jgi:hypothetical protein
LIEREKQEAVNAVNAKHFEEIQRLTGKLEDLGAPARTENRQ